MSTRTLRLVVYPLLILFAVGLSLIPRSIPYTEDGVKPALGEPIVISYPKGATPTDCAIMGMPATKQVNGFPFITLEGSGMCDSTWRFYPVSFALHLLAPSIIVMTLYFISRRRTL